MNNMKVTLPHVSRDIIMMLKQDLWVGLEPLPEIIYLFMVHEQSLTCHCTLFSAKTFPGPSCKQLKKTKAYMGVCVCVYKINHKLVNAKWDFKCLLM